jgi:hypothetical protein
MTGARLEHLNIICYKWGTRYSAHEVNILYASVHRHLGVPFRFFCLTDDPSGLRAEIEPREIPARARIGNGPKIYTFSEGFLGLGPDEHVVSLDIDVVIVGSLDFLLEHPERDFVIARHRSKKSISRGHGACYRVRVGSQREVWDRFIADPQAAAATFPGRKDVNAFSEQKWLEHIYRGRDLQFFPEGKVISFRRDCRALAPSFRLGESAGRWLSLAMLGEARLPGAGEAVVSFAGLTKPRDVIDHHHLHLRRAPFVKQFWHE